MDENNALYDDLLSCSVAALELIVQFQNGKAQADVTEEIRQRLVIAVNTEIERRIMQSRENEHEST